MQRSSTSALAFGLACFLVTTAARAGDPGARLVAAAGAEAVCVLRLPSLDALLKKADRFGKPFSAELSAMFPIFAPSLFQSPMAGQIDRTAPITFVLLDPKKHSPPFAYVAAVSDPAGYIASLSAPLQGADLGGSVLVSASSELARAALAVAPESGALPRIRGDLQVRIPVAALLRRYAEDIREAKTAFLESMKSMPPEPGLEGTEDVIEPAVKHYFSTLEGLGSQIEALDFGLELDGADLLALHSLHPVPGSSLESFFRLQGGSDPAALMAYLPQDAAMNFSFSLKSSPELLDSYMDAYLSWLRELGLDAKVIEELRPRLRSAVESMGPGYSGSVLAPDAKSPGFRMVQIFDDQKPEQLNAFIDEVSPKMLPVVRDYYKKLKLPIELSVGAPKAEGMPEGAREIRFELRELTEEQREALFGPLHGESAMRLYSLPLSHRVLFTFGPDAEELLKTWAAALSGASGPAGAAVPPMSLPGARIGIVTLDLRALLSLAPPPEMDAEQMKRILQVLQPISVSASVEGPVLHGEMRYPLETTLTAVKAMMDKKNAGEEP